MSTLMKLVVEAATSDPPYVRVPYSSTLKKFQATWVGKAEGAVDKLMDIARRDSDRELRSKAIFWLGQSRDPRVLKFLEELINR